MKNIDHFYHQQDLPLQTQVLNISVNLARVGNWVYQLQDFKDNPKVYQGRLELIGKINKQTNSYLNDLYSQDISDIFKPTLEKCKKEFDELSKKNLATTNLLYWAEKALTWANILQHRAKLA